jgi:hypothetical protein
VKGKFASEKGTEPRSGGDKRGSPGDRPITQGKKKKKKKKAPTTKGKETEGIKRKKKKGKNDKRKRKTIPTKRSLTEINTRLN